MFYDVSLEKGWLPILLLLISIVFFAISIPFSLRFFRFFEVLPFIKNVKTQSDSKQDAQAGSNNRTNKKPVMRFSSKKTLKIQFTVSVLLCLIWLFLLYMGSEVWLVFGVNLGYKVICSSALGGFFVIWMCTSIFLFRSARRIAIIAGAAVITLNASLAVSNVYGQYPTIGALLGKSTLAQLSDEELENIRNATKINREKPENERMTISRWKGSEEQKNTDPSSGISRSAYIPGTVSGFDADNAQIYIPPAALSSAPPDLPVIVMLTGQPGNPVQAFQGGRIDKIAAKYAEENDGLSPIVIVPDHLSKSKENTLCINSVKGNAETYLTVDLISWLKNNLPVSSDTRDWSVGGFSMGGTCAVTLGPRYPQIWGNLMTFSVEERPGSNISEKTVADIYFGGNMEKYKAFYPAEIIKNAAPSKQNLLMASGEYDGLSAKNEEIIGQAAVRSGMTVSSAEAAEAGHDWYMTRTCFAYFFALLGKQSGISQTNVDRSKFKTLHSLPDIPYSKGIDENNITAER